jgi:hypothetical protein
MKINRRDFLGHTTAGLLILPDIKLKDNELHFVSMPNNFGGPYMKVVKGDHECVFSTCFKGGVDYHNVCVTGEMALLVVQELEYGKKGIEQLLSIGLNEEKKRKQMLISLKKYNLTKEEKLRVFSLMKKIRGHHECNSLYNSPQSIWRQEFLT